MITAISAIYDQQRIPLRNTGEHGPLSLKTQNNRIIISKQKINCRLDFPRASGTRKLDPIFYHDGADYDIL